MNAVPEGRYVKHYRYGMGIVTQSDADLTSIDFDLHGLKKFVTSLLVVELTTLRPPKHLRAGRKQEASAKAAAARMAPGETAPGKAAKSSVAEAAGAAASRSRLQGLLTRKRKPK